MSSRPHQLNDDIVVKMAAKIFFKPTFTLIYAEGRTLLYKQIGLFISTKGKVPLSDLKLDFTKPILGHANAGPLIC